MENSINFFSFFFLKPSLRRVTQNPKDWQHLAWIAHVWPHLAPFCPVCTIWPSLVPFGPAWLLWPPLAPFSPIWSCLAPFGLSYPVWCCFALFDPVWPNLSLSKLGVPYLPCNLVWTKIGLDKHSSVYPISHQWYVNIQAREERENKLGLSWAKLRSAKH